MIDRKTRLGSLAAAATLIGAAGAMASGATDIGSAVRKLYDGAWKEAPARIDATFCTEFALRKWSPAEARKIAESALEAAEGPEAEPSAEREELVQMNVEEWLKEQESPRRIVQRIRTDADRCRLDQAVLSGGSSLDPSTRLSDTYVTLGRAATAEGYQAFHYYGPTRSAMILPDQTKQAVPPVGEWLTVPYAWILRLQWGRLDKDGRLVPDPKRRDDCIAAGGITGRGMTIRVYPETTKGPAGVPLDRVEFYGGEGGRQLTASMICDRQDYTRVYRFEAYDPSGAVRVLREVDQYDEQGNPVTLRMETYGENGAAGERRSVHFLRVDRDPVFSDEVFAFRPPDGYAVHDLRRSPALVVAPGRPDAPEAGETISEILALGAPPALTGDRPRRERLIELPTSRPTQQPETRPSRP